MLIFLERYFAPLRTGGPLLAVALFIVIVLNIIGRVSRSSCNWVLSGLKLMMECAWQDAQGGMSPARRDILDNFPSDLRSVRLRFDLDPDVVIYATCPKCCSTYAPTYAEDLAIYPARCTYTRFAGGVLCGAALTKRRSHHGKSVRVPLRPFGYQKFHSFVAGLLSRPGIEELMAKTARSPVDESILTDIWDGSGMRDLRGPDGRDFCIGPPGEARLVWNLSVDWFNPGGNKISGKKVSVGSMAMICLNLPPSLRSRPENMWLSILPGRREPSNDEMNHFLRPLVDDMDLAWEVGVQYSRTYLYPRGRRVRSALCALVSDMPARQKAGGAYKGWLNAFLTTLRMKDINNINDEVSTKR